MKSALQLQGIGLDWLLAHEWLATNALGGFACSSVCGLNTRKYHGMLIAAMAPPVRRMVLLSRMEETVWRDSHRFSLDCNEYPGVIYPQGHLHLRAFSHHPFPRWLYAGDGWELEKTLRLIQGENTVVLSYRLLKSPGALDLEARPLLAMRPIHELTYQWNGPLSTEDRGLRHHRIPATTRTPEVFFAHDGRFTASATWYLNQIYRQEQMRGYGGLEDLWSPGTVRFHLTPGQTAHFVCSIDPIDLPSSVRLADEQYPAPATAASADPWMDGLRRAAGQFIVSEAREPSGRRDSSERRTTTCITSYPWAAPSGRDAMIAFTGLFLVPGRFAEARALLEWFSGKPRNGLLPSQFPENGSPPEYQAADVSFWFINALWHYLRYTSDDSTVRRLLDVALQIVADYRHGAELGIRAEDDALIAGRAPGMPITWMDAKVGDWVVTPRVGLPVELNALWYNALCITAQLCARYERHDRARSITGMAASVHRAFNARFWNESGGYCFDVIDDHGQDPAVRPNQLLALSLPFAVLSSDRHPRVLQKIKAELLCPMGLRTLSSAGPEYQGHCRGNVVARDRAYHNGSAFPWLLGHYVTALLKVRGRRDQARKEARDVLRPCIEYLLGDGLGQLGELFEGDPPHQLAGSLASAASVGEIFRSYCEDILDLGPLAPAAKVTPAAGALAPTP